MAFASSFLFIVDRPLIPKAFACSYNTFFVGIFGLEWPPPESGKPAEHPQSIVVICLFHCSIIFCAKIEFSILYEAMGIHHDVEKNAPKEPLGAVAFLEIHGEPSQVE
jgi:hypothetical protein